MLTFKSSPDFEMMTGKLERRFERTLGQSWRLLTEMMTFDRVEVTVSVTDVEETGKITWTVDSQWW